MDVGIRIHLSYIFYEKQPVSGSFMAETAIKPKLTCAG